MEKIEFRQNDLCVESTPSGDKLYLFNKIEGDAAYFLETNIFGESKHVTFPLEGLENRFYKVIHNNVAQKEDEPNDTPAKRMLCLSRKKAKKISELKKGDKFYFWIDGCSGPYVYEYTLIYNPYYEQDYYRYREGSTLLPVFENGFEKEYEAYAKHNDKEYSWNRRLTKWVVATSLEKLVKVVKSKFKKDISDLKIKSYGEVNRSE